MNLARVQRRTLVLLMISQVIGGVGVAIGVSVGALLTKRLAGGAGLSGLAQSAAVVGGALLAIPVTRLMNRAGRRPGLVLAYLIGALGAVIVVGAAVTGAVWLAFLGMFCFGGGTAANLQARYSAVDLAEPARRGMQLSIVVWATTIGSVAGPSLSPVADTVLQKFWPARPENAGPFVVSAVAFCLAGVVIWALLRPDPLLVARSRSGAGESGAAQAGGVGAGDAESGGAGGVAVVAEPRLGMRAAFRMVMGYPAARLGIAAVAIGHLVMVGVMSMTPIYIDQNPHLAHGDVLSVVGLVLSVHIAGMYALSPLVGWLTDRYGRRPVILTGIALLVAACAVAGSARHGTPQLAIGLTLLGLGWSCTMIAGSTLLAESVPVERRPSAQGLSDLVMGLAGASAGALAGVVVQFAGYPVLAVLAAATTVPVLALALRVRIPARA